MSEGTGDPFDGWTIYGDYMESVWVFRDRDGLSNSWAPGTPLTEVVEWVTKAEEADWENHA